MAAGNVVDFNSVVGTVTDSFRSIFNTVAPPSLAPPPRKDVSLGLTPGGLGFSAGNIGAGGILVGLLAVVLVVGLLLRSR